MDLFDWRPEPDDDATIQASFERFHAAHPDVYAHFERFALDLIQAGRQHYGAKSIMERIRWHYVTSSSGEEFKLNNVYTSRYVRLFIQRHPEHEGFFETRQLKAP